MCWFSQVIQLSGAIRTFTRTTLWRRGKCNCIGSLTIKTPPCTESNCTALGSEAQAETPKPPILQWKYTRGRLSPQEPPWKHVGHRQSSPSLLMGFQSSTMIRKDHKAKGSRIEGFILHTPILQAGYRDWVCSPQNTPGICSRAGTSLQVPQNLSLYLNDVDFSYNIYFVLASIINQTPNDGHSCFHEALIHG